MNFGEVRSVQNPLFLTPHVGTSGIFLDLLRSLQILKRECSAESGGKLPLLFIHSKIATLVPEFVVEYLPFGRTAALVSEFAVEHSDVVVVVVFDDDDDHEAKIIMKLKT